MLFGKESFRKKNNGAYLIGYRLSEKYAQISFLRIGENQPYTFSMVAGMEEYNLPLCLFRKEEEKLWLMGKEAVDALARKDASAERASRERAFMETAARPPEGLLENLLQRAFRGEQVQVYGETYEARALLALYVKKSLSLLSLEISLNNIAAIVFTVDDLNQEKVAALREMTQYLQLGKTEMYFMTREESFFWYNLHTEQSLWKGQVMLYEMEEEGLVSFRLYVNRNTTPLVTIVEKKTYPEAHSLCEKKVEGEIRDQLFLKLCQEDFQGKTVSAVYLIGEGFSGDWYQETLKFFCQNRRVFRGNNLYSKGACQGLLQKLEPDKLAETYVYLGEDKLLANVGMNLLRQGEKSYLAILNGGSSWNDGEYQWDVILEGDNQLVFRITPLNGKEIVDHVMILSGLHPLKQPVVRIHLEIRMSSPREFQIKAWDRGFGQIYPSGGRVWEETIEL